MSTSTPCFTATVPLLQTPRLLLREYRPADFDAFAAHVSDPVSAEHLGLSDRITAWRLFCSHAGMWLLYGAGWWTMELRESGQPVGHVGAFLRDGSGGLEVGWSTYRPFGGQGYASEAAAAVLDHAFHTRRESQVHALIAAANTPSLRVAERLGFAFERDVELHGKAVGRYVRKVAPSASVEP